MERQKIAAWAEIDSAQAVIRVNRPGQPYLGWTETAATRIWPSFPGWHRPNSDGPTWTKPVNRHQPSRPADMKLPGWAGAPQHPAGPASPAPGWAEFSSYPVGPSLVIRLGWLPRIPGGPGHVSRSRVGRVMSLRSGLQRSVLRPDPGQERCHPKLASNTSMLIVTPAW